MAKPKSSAPDTACRERRERRRRAFSLVEVVIATAVISFALLAILGVMAASLSTHMKAGTDSVLTLMTESSLQEMRNLAGGSATNSFGSISTANTYYLYFDSLGQVTADGNSSTAGGDYELGTTNATAPTADSVPATNSTAVSSLPAGTVYQCAVTVAAPSASNFPQLQTAASPYSLYQLTLTFTSPVGAASPKTNIVNATISNPNVY